MFSAASGASEVRLPEHSSLNPFCVTEQVLHKEMLQIPLKPSNSGSRMGATLKMLLCLALRPCSFTRHQALP